MLRACAKGWGWRITAKLAVLALVLLGVPYGLAHQPTPPPDLAAFALPDGTLPTLCADVAGESDRDGEPANSCLIACLQAIGVPSLLATTGPCLPARASQQRPAARSRAVVARTIWAAARARAPPLVLSTV